MDKLRYSEATKSYPRAPAPAVDRVSLSVPEGRFVVLLGPSGSGKTTLLKMANRLIEPTGGAVLLDGVDVRRQEVTRLRLRMGYVIQQVGLFPHMTVAQNVAVAPELLGWARERVAARVAELLALVHLPPEYRSRYPAQLSGGEAQRVGLARALAGDPEVLLMDEPFGAIDALTRARLQDEIRALHQALGKTILFVTHDVDEALRLADQIAVLREGRLVQVGTPCALLARPADGFVRGLLGADDRVRQLGLLLVSDAMEPGVDALADGGIPGGRSLPPGASLRQALSLFLEPGVEALAVVEDGQPVGRLTFDRLRQAACWDGEGSPWPT
jgi:osmoprotectant transport system ATP-binding protein